MKLSRREGALIKALLVIAIGILYVNYLMLPGIEHYKSVKIEREQVKKRYEDAINNVSEEEALDNQIESFIESTNNILQNYFTSTKQEELVLLLDDFISQDIEVYDITFSKTNYLEVGEGIIEQQTADIQYNGTYANVLAFMDQNWDFYKQIAINRILLYGNGNGDSNGDMSLSYYWTPSYDDYQDQLFYWVQNEAYFKGNPFITSSAVERNNNIFIGGNADKLQDLFNKPFADVGGHWAEAEIESFRQSGFVIADSQNNFYPDSPITRGEFIIMLDKIYSWPIPEGNVDLSNFEDYDELGNYEGAIAKAILKGYMGGYVIGYTDNTLRPRDPITYEEIEYIMSKIKEDESFNWDMIGQRILDDRGITSPGLAEKNLSVTRAEAVYMMYFYK